MEKEQKVPSDKLKLLMDLIKTNKPKRICFTSKRHGNNFHIIVHFSTGNSRIIFEGLIFKYPYEQLKDLVKALEKNNATEVIWQFEPKG